jgi:hypothetical protein
MALSPHSSTRGHRECAEDAIHGALAALGPGATRAALQEVAGRYRECAEDAIHGALAALEHAGPPRVR